MAHTPSINAILRRDPVSSKRRAPMGARNFVSDGAQPTLIQPVMMIDGDYASDGTYWGSGGDPLWCAFNPATPEFDAGRGARVYVRAPSKERAKELVAAWMASSLGVPA